MGGKMKNALPAAGNLLSEEARMEIRKNAGPSTGKAGAPMFAQGKEETSGNRVPFSDDDFVAKGYSGKGLSECSHSGDEFHACQDGCSDGGSHLRADVLDHSNCIRFDNWITIRRNGEKQQVQLKDLDVEYGLTDMRESNIDVLSMNGFVKLQGAVRRRVKKFEQMYEFRTIQGEKINCTGKHKVPITREERELLVNAGDIRVGDMFFTHENREASLSQPMVNTGTVDGIPGLAGMKKRIRVRIITINFQTCDVFDLETEDGYFVVNGLIVHNCSLFNKVSLSRNGCECDC